MDISLDLLVKDAVLGVVSRYEELLGRESEALCTALALTASCFEAEFRVRLPTDNPVYVENARAFVEGLASKMVQKLLDSRVDPGVKSV